MVYLNAAWFIFLFVLLLQIISHSRFFGHRRVHPLLFQMLFCVKVAAGILMTFIYSQFYSDRSTADIFKYFDDSGVMMQAMHDGQPAQFAKMVTGIDSRNPELDKYYVQMVSWDEKESLYNDSRIIIRLNAMLRFVSFGNYYVHMLAMCFISLIGLTLLFHVLIKMLNEKFMLIFFALFCLPSVVFWYSGMLKDGLLIFGLGSFLYVVFCREKFRMKPIWFLFLVASFILLLFLKTYVLLIVFPGILLMLNKSEKPVPAGINILKWMVVYGCWIVVLTGIGFIKPQFNFVDMLIQKQQNFFLLAQQMKAGSYFDINPIKSFTDLIFNSPQAFFNVMFRPFIYENRSPVVLMAAIENVLIFAAGIYSVINRRKIAAEQMDLFLFSIAFTVLLFVLIGLVVPVAGAIVRYKVTALPFLFLIFVILVDKEKAKNHLRLFRVIK